MQVFLTNLAMTGFILTKVYCDYLVGHWAYADDQRTRFGYYLTMITISAVACSGFVFCRVVSLTTFSWFGTKKLHEDMIKRVLAAPINLYFDTTPIGRILNKFSKDLSIVETVICWSYGNFYVPFYTLIMIVIMSIYIVPWVSVVFPFIVLITYYFFQKSIGATKEVSRVESVTKSPLLNFLSETLSGSSTIRAYGNKDYFL